MDKSFNLKKHFKPNKECEHCNGTGTFETLIPIFNVKTMDFDIKTHDYCRYCTEESRDDFYSYLEDNQ